jgi:hypothetical protein
MVRYRVVWCVLLVGGPVAAVSGTLPAQVMPAVEAVHENLEIQVVDAARLIGDPWWDDANPHRAEERRPPGQVQVQSRNAQRGLTILRRELSLVRATCPSLAPDARGAVLTAGVQSFSKAETAKPAAAPALKVVAPGGVVRMQVGGSVRQPDVTPVVEAAVAKAVADHATPEEAKAFAREVTARGARRREAVVAILVEAVDQTALLDEGQRQALARALDKNWQPLWERLVFQVGQPRITGRQLPPGVAAVVADVLGPDAFTIWQERLRRLPGS